MYFEEKFSLINMSADPAVICVGCFKTCESQCTDSCTGMCKGCDGCKGVGQR